MRVLSTCASVLALAVCASGFAPQTAPALATDVRVFARPTDGPVVGTSRRGALAKFAAGAVLLGNAKQAAAVTKPEVLKVVQDAQDALTPVPDLLQNEQWDAVRTVFKVKLGNLWNLGENKNPIRLFAQAEGEPDLLDATEELTTALQLADQFTYDNVFIYFQPGAGKVNIKEPTNQVRNAQKKLTEIASAIEAL